MNYEIFFAAAAKFSGDRCDASGYRIALVVPAGVTKNAQRRILPQQGSPQCDIRGRIKIAGHMQTHDKSVDVPHVEHFDFGRHLGRFSAQYRSAFGERSKCDLAPGQSSIGAAMMAWSRNKPQCPAPPAAFFRLARRSANGPHDRSRDRRDGARSRHCSDPFRAHVNWEWDHRESHRGTSEIPIPLAALVPAASARI
jgi:hypothetical protein